MINENNNHGSLATRGVIARVWSGSRGLLGLIAVASALALAPTVVQAQSSGGAIVGQADGADATVQAVSLATGATYEANVSPTGAFRIGSLPPGRYRVTMTKPGAAPVEREVTVVIGSTQGVAFDDTQVLETFTVSDTRINPIDFGKVESVTVLTETQIDILPVARNTNAVALLSPGTTRGDTAFGDEGNLVSFGGSSVSENGYYVNGFNISNFRNGLDPAQIPFEAYSQFETLTGAYSAQFGRSTGGVINATTKSGSNEFHGGVNVYYTPDEFTDQPPSSFFFDPDNPGDPVPYAYNRADFSETLEANVFASGPIVKDRLFFYGIYNMRRIKDHDAYATLGTYDRTKADDPFYLIKLDAIPFDNHRLEYTGFRDKRTKTIMTYSNFNFEDGTYDPQGSEGWEFRGGTTHIGRYTGTFGDFTLSAMYGKSEQDRRALTEADAEPLVLDTRVPPTVQLAGNTSATGVIDSMSLDTRKALRVDLEYAFSLAGEHRLLVGFDQEDNESVGESAYTSPPETGYWRYSRTGSSGPSTVNGVQVPASTDVARFRVLDSGGSFGVKTEAYYLEDNWTLAENRLLLRLGIRNERFENLNALGETFVKIDNQWAPRLGVSYDLFGDRRTKVFANYGRYHLPVASNTNLRLAGGEFFTETWYYLNGLDGYLPVLGAQIGATNVLSDGEVPDTRTIVDLDLKPMYQDEIVLGIQHEVSRNLTVGVRGIARELGTVMDDMIIDHALVEWGVRNGMGDRETLEDEILGSFHYVLGNPGRQMRTAWDFDGDGEPEETILTAEDLGYPKAERKYYSVEVFAEKVWDGKWTAQFSYTWAHSYGNSEGWVLSDNGQDDAGITVMFDTPDLTALSYGNLANDVRHHFKFFGAYAFSPEFTVGANAYLKSGRPINRFVNVDEPVIGLAYGNDYFGVKRGSAGTTPWVFNLDLSFVWSPKNAGFLGDGFRAQVDIFNVLGMDSATEVYERFEEDQLLGTPNPRYGIGTSWQSPRSVRFSAGWEF